MLETKKTFCRFCHAFCGLEVDIDDGRISDVRGDKDNLISEGYTCPKGRAEAERLYHPDRLPQSLKRNADDSFSPIANDQAIDEIVEQLKDIIDKHGPRAVAVYVGCAGHRTSAGGPWYIAKWLEALGSPGLYTSYTIDSPSLTIAAGRLFGAPLPLPVFDIDHAESAMFVATNPVVSHLWSMPQPNPATRLKRALLHGMKLVVIDPRRSDVARKADVHLALKPGEDASLLACLIKTIIDNDWHDQEYVANYVSGFEALYEAVKPFSLEYAATRCELKKEDILEAARLFSTAASGAALSGTGLHMARHQNLSTQLVMTINVICGRYDRRGGMTRHQGTLTPLLPKEGNEPLPLPMFSGEKSRIRGINGINGLFGYKEMPTNTLADEILLAGDGQIRALIVNGGNPALVFPDMENTQKALQNLDLLVVNDLFLSATARHADYVIAAKHPFERPDIPQLSDPMHPAPFSQYTPAMVESSDEVIEEWRFFWRLAQKLGIELDLGLDMAEEPDFDSITQALNPGARICLEDVKTKPSGQFFGEETLEVGGVVPDMIGHADHRFAAGHPEIIAELGDVLAEPVIEKGGFTPEADFAFRLITYRTPEVYCTQGHNLPSLEKRRPFNPALMNPADMQQLSLKTGDQVELESEYGKVEAIVEASDTLRSGTIGLAHGWGDPLDKRPVSERGTCVQALIPGNKNYNKLTGMAQQSAIPVNVLA